MTTNEAMKQKPTATNQETATFGAATVKIDGAEIELALSLYLSFNLLSSLLFPSHKLCRKVRRIWLR
jgi:hypothetical protein